MGETFAGIASSGPLLLAILVSAAAGLVSFLSPCVLPLMPGYLSYVTGLAGADLDAALGAGGGRAAPPQDAGAVAVLAEPAPRSSARCSGCPGCRAPARPSARCSRWPPPAARPTAR